MSQRYSDNEWTQQSVPNDDILIALKSSAYIIFLGKSKCMVVCGTWWQCTVHCSGNETRFEQNNANIKYK